MENAINIVSFSASYNQSIALKEIDLHVPQYSIYAFIGPSGCGKTTLLRSINRLNDLIRSFSCKGEIRVGGENIYATNKKKCVERMRKSIGMVFQQPNPLPTTILNNLTMPLREHYYVSQKQLYDMAIEKLKMVNLYDEVKDRLHKAALQLSGGQQQRLCIARALMLDPKILLFDEPCSALDPISTFAIESLILELSKQYTIVMVTHNMEQAMRISDYTAFFYQGVIVEHNKTVDLFLTPQQALTKKYITGQM